MLPSKPTAFTLTSWKDEKFYWEGGWDSSTPDPVVTFDIEVKPGALGEIAIGYLRSHQYNLGKAICSVAGQSVTLDGTWKRKVSLAQCVPFDWFLFIFCLNRIVASAGQLLSPKNCHRACMKSNVACLLLKRFAEVGTKRLD